jgi:EAL domain-containing protein (putative c-di-GMP-specific phosphodiesterase class I)
VTFIPLAESCGQATALAFHILRQASRSLPEWRVHAPGLRVAVNISMQTMQDPLFADRLAAFLVRNDARAEWFELEITESTFMHEPERTLETVEHVRRLGFVVSIDDFGTGYSSLSYLKRLPVDTVKIDRSFVASIETEGRDTAIVQAVVAFAEGIGLTVTVEGVENLAQVDTVRDLGCDRGQGYYFSRPLPVDQLTALLGRRRLAA